MEALSCTAHAGRIDRLRAYRKGMPSRSAIASVDRFVRLGLDQDLYVRIVFQDRIKRIAHLDNLFYRVLPSAHSACLRVPATAALLVPSAFAISTERSAPDREIVVFPACRKAAVIRMSNQRRGATNSAKRPDLSSIAFTSFA